MLDQLDLKERHITVYSFDVLNKNERPVFLSTIQTKNNDSCLDNRSGFKMQVVFRA